jgi:adenylate kinase
MNSNPVQERRSAGILLGSPGAGKTTFAQKLAKRPGIVSIGIGPLLKEQAHGGFELSHKIRPFLERGELVPEPLVEQVLNEEIKNVNKHSVFFDGYPRTMGQVDRFFQLCRLEDLELKAVAVLSLRKQEAVERLSRRRVCPQCGAVYNLAINPPKESGICDRCGGRLILREDDRPEAIERRFEEYEKQTRPVEEFFSREYPQITRQQSGDLTFDALADEIVDLLGSRGVPGSASRPTALGATDSDSRS